MIVVIDNYDSFTFNLVQYLGEMDTELVVHRNDRISLPDISDCNPSGIVISPGPGRPEDAGISVTLIKEFASICPILGVCLGHQAIAVAMGGTVAHAPELMHGKTSKIRHGRSRLFEMVPDSFEATRYHSLLVCRDDLPDSLKVTAETHDGLIMAMEHRDKPVFGVQFHPESILCPDGKRILRNFMEICEEHKP